MLFKIIKEISLRYYASWKGCLGRIKNVFTVSGPRGDIGIHPPKIFQTKISKFLTNTSKNYVKTPFIVNPFKDTI
jgi:hypothetical protein